MTRNRHTGFRTGTVTNHLGNAIGYGRIAFLLLFFLQFLLAKLGIFLGDGTLCHCKNGESLAGLMAGFDGFYNLVVIVRNLRKQNNIRTGCNTGVQGQPANLVSHNFYDEDTVVGSCCSMDTINGFTGNIHCTVESEGHICSIDIIINGLRKMDDIQSLFPKEVRCFLGAVTT